MAKTNIVGEFREFIARGNVIDLAVGVIIGASFNGIVKSLVDQIIMPPIGFLTGGVDFSRFQWILRPENPATPAIEKVSIQYGAFINTVIQFLIVAWVVFLLVKLVNAIRRKEAETPAPSVPPAPTPTEKVLTEIRDLLAAQQGAPPPVKKTPVKRAAARKA